MRASTERERRSGGNAGTSPRGEGIAELPRRSTQLESATVTSGRSRAESEQKNAGHAADHAKQVKRSETHYAEERVRSGVPSSLPKHLAVRVADRSISR